MSRQFQDLAQRAARRLGPHGKRGSCGAGAAGLSPKVGSLLADVLDSEGESRGGSGGRGGPSPPASRWSGRESDGEENAELERYMERMAFGETARREVGMGGREEGVRGGRGRGSGRRLPVGGRAPRILGSDKGEEEAQRMMERMMMGDAEKEEEGREAR